MEEKMSIWRTLAAAIVAAQLCIAPIAPASATIEKIMLDCRLKGEMQLCPVFRPSFKAPEGWSVDKKTGAQRGIEIFLPDGATFGEAPALIFGEARYNGEKLPLAEWIANSDKKWIGAQPGSKVIALPAGDLGAGKREVILHRYENPKLKHQPIELIAYFAEDDADGNSFVVRLTLSGLAERDVAAARPVFESVLKSY
jgi:hypothetical protein